MYSLSSLPVIIMSLESVLKQFEFQSDISKDNWYLIVVKNHNNNKYKFPFWEINKWSKKKNIYMYK
jgi:hypothetical protein